VNDKAEIYMGKVNKEVLWSRSSGLSQMCFSHENNRLHHGARRNSHDTKNLEKIGRSPPYFDPATLN